MPRETRGVLKRSLRKACRAILPYSRHDPSGLNTPRLPKPRHSIRRSGKLSVQKRSKHKSVLIYEYRTDSCNMFVTERKNRAKASLDLTVRSLCTPTNVQRIPTPPRPSPQRAQANRYVPPSAAYVAVAAQLADGASVSQTDRQTQTIW